MNTEEFNVTDEEWEEARGLLREIKDLLDCPGWTIFMELLKKNAENRSKYLGGKIMRSLKDILLSQAEAGELQGLRFAITFIDTLKESALMTIDQYKAQENLHG